MLMSLTLGADFRRCVWIRGISHMLFATPDHAAVRELFYASTMWGFSSERVFIHCSDGLVLAISRKAWKCAFSVRIEGRLCKVVDVNCGESTL